MTAVVLETLSSKKLAAITFFAFSLQLLCFVLAGYYSPASMMAQPVLPMVCLVPYTRKWPIQDKPIYINDRSNPNHRNCSYGSLVNFEDTGDLGMHVKPSQLVMVYEYPLVRDDTHLSFSPWFFFNSATLHFRLSSDVSPSQKWEPPPGGRVVITMHVSIGVSPGGSSTDYTEVAATPKDAPINRNLDCTPSEDSMYSCDLVDLYYFGHSHYPKMVVNLVLPHEEPSMNSLPRVTEIGLTWISQTGGFMTLWISFKTVFFVLITGVTVWYAHRLKQLTRDVVLLEKMNLALAVAAFILNFPVDWLALSVRMPFFTLWMDIRQGIFNAVLAIFWMVFVGEHMVDEEQRNHLGYYKKHLVAISVAVLCMFTFEICERGYQLVDPFFTVYSTDTGETLAYAVIGLALVASVVYFLILLSMIVKVIYQMWKKRAAIPSLVRARRLYYQNIIYRFTFLMVFTVVCAGLSVASFIAGQFYEMGWKFEDATAFEFMSAFQFGVYGGWNVYVMLMLALYAPSHKKFVGVNLDDNDEADEVVELTQVSNRPSQVAGLLTKEQTD